MSRPKQMLSTDKYTKFKKTHIKTGGKLVNSFLTQDFTFNSQTG